jgi:amidase
MSVRRPTKAEIAATASRVHLSLDPADVDAFTTLVGDTMEALYAPLDGMADDVPQTRYPRTTGRRPADGEDPLNAWYVKSRIEGAATGLLKGKTVAIKDAVAVAGVPMMNGASSLEGYVPDFDATAVTRILDAGGAILGKANCEYFCYSGSSHTNAIATTLNPYDHAFSTGGSSSGCAALVASSEVDMALGGDQGGSVRTPSAFCGIVGMKPTFGLVPFTGAASMDMTLDHLGPMTRNVADNALMLEALAGPDGLDPRQSGALAGRYVEALAGPARGLRIGIVEEGFGHPQSEPDVDEAVRRAAQNFAALGAVVEPLSVPMHRLAMSIWAPIAIEGVYSQMFRGNGVGDNWRGLYATSYLEAQSAWPERANMFPEGVKLALLAGEHLRHAYRGRYYAKAQNLSRKLRAAYDLALARHDLLLMPTTPVKGVRLPARPPASRQEALTPGFMPIVNTAPFNVSGHPAISVPCAKIDGLPIGMMLIGRWFDEATLYRAAAAFEGTIDQSLFTPPAPFPKPIRHDRACPTAVRFDFGGQSARR